MEPWPAHECFVVEYMNRYIPYVYIFLCRLILLLQTLIIVFQFLVQAYSVNMSE